MEIHALATDEDSKMTEYDVMTDMMGLVADIFKGQFDFDDILDGVASEDLSDWLRDIIDQAVTKDKKAQLKKRGGSKVTASP